MTPGDKCILILIFLFIPFECKCGENEEIACFSGYVINVKCKQNKN